MSINFQIPEFIRGYIGLIDTEVLQAIGIFLIFVMIIIVLRRVRNLRDEVAALQRRSLADPQARQQTAPDGGFALNRTALKLAVMETELKALKDMVTELRQARDDWKAQAGRAPPWSPPIHGPGSDTPPTLAPAPIAAPAPTAAPKPEKGAVDVLDKNRTAFPTRPFV